MLTRTRMIRSLPLLLLGYFFSCEKPTEPKTDPDTEPDTTSQNFEFTTFEFGDGFATSDLWDAWVFDENNVWVVGWIQQDEFNGNCNIMRWNGNEWKYINSGDVSSSSGFYSIWALDSSTIYFGNGVVGKYKNGNYSYENTSQIVFDRGQSIEKLWGSSENNIWGVGPWGMIVHFDGVSWKKVDFDSSWYFWNITGNKQTGEAYALASKAGNSGIIVRLANGTAQTLIQSYYIGPNCDLEFISDESLLFGVTTIQSLNINTKSVNQYHPLFLDMSIIAINAATKKDIYFWGLDKDFGYKLIHNNGVRFKEFKLSGNFEGIPGGTHTYKNFTVATGSGFNGKALAFFIKRLVP